MRLSFDAFIDGPEICAVLESDTDLAAPVWCFSLMAPAVVLEGGALETKLAGYMEIRLPDLCRGQKQRLRLRHENERHVPGNRAWLPLGGYLRLQDGSCHPLPRLPAGVISGTAPTPTLAPFEGLRLVPQPTEWYPTGGQLRVDRFASEDARLQPADDMSRRLGFGGLLAEGGAALVIEDRGGMPPDGYILTIDRDGVRIVAGDRGGVFYAGVTLITLIATHHGRLPCGVITDSPRFGWRGQHLDSVRHFFGTGTIARLLDLMALLKLNRFHWHLSDDEAFRLETETAPDLWQNSAFRGEGEVIPGVFGGGIRAGGTYRKAEVSALIAHATALNIEILPEIEIPAHALALTRIRPELRDPEDQGQEVSVQGYPGNAVNPALPEVAAVLVPLLTEVGRQFPFGMVHLGCDELPPGTWDGSPKAAVLKQREGLNNRDDLQGWFMAQTAESLVAQGLKVAAWEEAARGAQGGIGHDALMFSWTGQAAGIAAARMGHQVVMCPAQYAYLDMAHSADPEDWGATWAAVISLEDTVTWRVVPEGAEDIDPMVVGVQGCFWGEFTTADREMEAMLAPRLLGLACKAWCAEGAVDGPMIRALAGHYGAVFDRIGWEQHRST